MRIHSAMLVSDWLILSLVAALLIIIIIYRHSPHLREPWRYLCRQRVAMASFVVLICYISVGLLDSIHLRVTYPQQAYAISQVKSLLDLMLGPMSYQHEKTYSAPFAIYLYNRNFTTSQSNPGNQRLRYGGRTVSTTNTHAHDIIKHLAWSLGLGLLSLAIFLSLCAWWLAYLYHKKYLSMWRQLLCGSTVVAWREILITLSIIWLVIAIIIGFVGNYHIMGTDKVGRDVFYEAIKSIRTGLLIGTLTTLFMLPFAVVLGTLAGYFRGWVDDIIQYLYTTLSSIPGVLLISATILVMQVYIANHQALFPTLIQRADARLLALCFILGITSWASLCRLLRGETLKLREYEYIKASRALGARRLTIIIRHIVPNVLHIVLITLVLDFSGLVLAEAVLSYVGVGVDPTTMSWGNMINSSRLELAREPIVWWPLLAALIFMFVLVLAANLFADRVRDALDPRLRQ